MKKFISLLLLIATPYTLLADATIPYNCRVPNESPGWCLWAAIATAARAQGIRELYNLKDDRKADPHGYIEQAQWDGREWHVSRSFVERNAGTMDSALDKLERLGYTRYKYQRYGTFSKKLIYEALDKGHGAIVQVDWDGEGIHAVLLTALNNYEVRFINSNNLREETRSRRWFENSWDGFVITLD